ncbi:MAG: tetratricopeptide repeat protein [Candidatus Protistobacter heckmanni]|nr:tetratricopeptide repeat protein [Candidatus Protistobacter heckmanni]
MDTSATPVADLFGQALELHGSGRFDQALALYVTILLNEPAHVDALNFSVIIHHEHGDNDEADWRMRKALTLLADLPDGKADPRYAAILVNHGNVLEGLRHHLQALALYEEALRLRPHFAEAHFNRGNLLHQFG